MRAEYGHGLFGAPDDDTGSSFQWLHLRPGEAESVLLGSEPPMWYKAHWWGGRMQPCGGEGCRLCEQGVGKQRRWVFPLVLRFQGKPYLWEVSEAVACEIREHAERSDGLIGLELRISRDSGGSKARIHVDSTHRCKPDEVAGVVFPDPAQCLELTWAVLDRQSESRHRSQSSADEEWEKKRLGVGEY